MGTDEARCEQCERLEKLVRQLQSTINVYYAETPEAREQYAEMIESVLEEGE